MKSHYTEPFSPSSDAQVQKLRSEEAHLKKSLFKKGVVSRDNLARVEKTGNAHKYILLNKFGNFVYKQIHLSLLCQLDENNYSKMKERRDDLLKQFKDHARLVGACKVLNMVDKMLQCNQTRDSRGLISAMEQFKTELKSLDEKIMPYFEVKQQVEELKNVELKLSLGGSKTKEEQVKLDFSTLGQDFKEALHQITRGELLKVCGKGKAERVWDEICRIKSGESSSGTG